MKYRIHQAVRKGDLTELQRALKDYDAHRWINAPCPREGYLSPLHMACDRRNESIVRMLLKNGADVHQKMPSEAYIDGLPDDLEEMDDLYAPIHFAVENSQNGYFAILDLLIRYGADINHRLLDGTTPLHIAVQANDKRMVQTINYLLENGACVNHRHGRGLTTALDDSHRAEFRDITDILSNVCQTCGIPGTTKLQLFSCPCNRHKYCSKECQSADEFHLICCNYFTRVKPRFEIGQKVKCMMLNDDGRSEIMASGVILRHWYKQDDFKKHEYAPYQIRMPCGSLVYAPTDTNEDVMLDDGKDNMLKNLPQFQCIKHTYERMKRKKRKKIYHLNPVYIKPKPENIVDDHESNNKENIISSLISYYGQK